MNRTEYNTLITSKLFKGFTSRQMDAICQVATPYSKTYKKDEIILSQGEKIRQVGILMKGRVLSIKYHYDGNPQIMRIITPGGIIALAEASSAESEALETLVADKNSTVLFFRYPDIFASGRIKEEQKVRILQNAISVLAGERMDAINTIDVLSHYTIRDRVVAFLKNLISIEQTNTIDIGMSQVQFAQYLRVNRSVLSKELNAMRRDGIIDFNETTYTLLEK